MSGWLVFLPELRDATGLVRPGVSAEGIKAGGELPRLEIPKDAEVPGTSLEPSDGRGGIGLDKNSVFAFDVRRSSTGEGGSS